MRFQWALYLAAAVSVHARGAVKRQNDDDDETSAVETTTTEQTTADTTTTTTDETTTTSQSNNDEDTTVIRTVTVTNDDVETVTSATTVFTTITTTIVVTSTRIEEETTTEQGDTSTSIQWETLTRTVRKRDLSPRTGVPREAPLTHAPHTTVPADWYDDARPAQGAHDLAKRDTVTELRTVTVDGDGDAETVVNTVRRTVTSSVESRTVITSTRTSTVQEGASTTITVTSTVTIDSTAVNTGDPSTGAPETTSTGEANGSSSSGGDNGLSTGAKAGIGAGVGVGGLVIIGALIWFCLKRRRSTKHEHDDLMGASEVPVGPSSPSHHQPSMAHHDNAAAFLAPSRASSKPTQEGYRGTAMGDGRAGFAKPAPYGAAYASTNNTHTVSPATAYSHTDRSSTLMSGDALPEHPSPSPVSATAEMGNDGGHAARWHDAGASEIDSRPAVNQQNGPVFEMPAQNYR